MVDDNPGDVRLVQAAVRQIGSALEVIPAVDGDSALLFLFAASRRPEDLPSLILLDLNLPGKTGFEVLDVIRAQPLLKTIPVVVLTSSNREEDVELSYAHGANSFISKPGSFDELCQVIAGLEHYWFRFCRIPVPWQSNGTQAARPFSAPAEAIGSLALEFPLL